MADRGLIVNLFQIGLMTGYNVKEAKLMMLDSYKVDKKHFKKYRNFTFAEYVNEKRKFMAEVCGYPQYK